jgi:hypothetical protein
MFAGLSPSTRWGTRADLREFEQAIQAPPPPRDESHEALAIARSLLAARHKLALFNVPYDGSCLLWALLPYLRLRYVRRMLSPNEARLVLVAAMGAPSLRADLEQDLIQHNSHNGHAPLPDTNALLDSFRQPTAYLNAILAAKAIELLTRDSVRIFWLVGGTELEILYASERGEPYAVQLFFEPVIEHYCLVMPLQRPVIEADGDFV